MNLTTLKIFRDLVETRSFSKAATLTSVTQSAVSQQVANLERKLKCLLVERGHRDFGLTPEGRRYYEGCKTRTGQFERMMAQLQEMSQRVSGAVRISTVYSIGLHELPPYIKQYLRQYPLVNVHVEYRRAPQVYEDVLESVADLGLVAFPEKRAHLEVRPFRRDRLVVICHPDHPLGASASIPIRRIIGHKFVGFDPDIPTRKALDSIFRRHRIKVEQVMDFDNVETLKRAVEINMGISLVPLSTVTQEVKNHSLRIVEFTDEQIFRPLGLISRRGRVLSPAIKAFLRVLEEEPRLS